MWFEYIYNLGRRFTFFPKVTQIDEKLGLIQFPYTSSEILSGVVLLLAVFGSLGTVLLIFVLPSLPLVGWSIIFYTFVIGFASYAYATGVQLHPENA